MKNGEVINYMIFAEAILNIRVINFEIVFFRKLSLFSVLEMLNLRSSLLELFRQKDRLMNTFVIRKPK